MDPHNLTMAFTVWAAVVAIMGGAMVFEMRAMRFEVREMKNALNEHILDTTARLTALESFNKLKHGYDMPYARRHTDHG